MTVFLLILCILSSGFTGNIYKKLSDKCHSAYDTAATPSVWFLCLGMFFTILSVVFGERISTVLMTTSIPAGACIFGAAYTLLLSMKVNALSVSVIIVNLNFVIPIILSVIFLNEKAGIIQILGMILSVTVIVLMNMGSGSERATKRRDILLPLIACLSNGLFNFFIFSSNLFRRKPTAWHISRVIIFIKKFF